jgi:hypothetical protein
MVAWALSHGKNIRFSNARCLLRSAFLYLFVSKLLWYDVSPKVFVDKQVKRSVCSQRLSWCGRVANALSPFLQS